MNYILIMGIINPLWVKGLQETPVTTMVYLSKFNKGDTSNYYGVLIKIQ